nr:hypothetical protein [Nitrosomonas nitrosa]
MSFGRAEFIAFFIVFLLAVIFLGASYFIIRDIGYGDGTVSQSEIAQQEFWASGLLNVATELVGAVALYLVFKVLFRLGDEQSTKSKEGVPAPGVSTLMDEDQQHMWKKPLKEVVELLVRDKKLSSDSIGLFSRYKLPDGTELLTAQDVRELRTELTKPKSAPGEQN